MNGKALRDDHALAIETKFHERLPKAGAIVRPARPLSTPATVP
jgi:hypothetical protein